MGQAAYWSTILKENTRRMSLRPPHASRCNALEHPQLDRPGLITWRVRNTQRVAESSSYAVPMPIEVACDTEGGFQ